MTKKNGRNILPQYNMLQEKTMLVILSQLFHEKQEHAQRKIFKKEMPFIFMRKNSKKLFHSKTYNV